MDQIVEFLGSHYSDLIRIDGNLEIKAKDNIFKLEFSPEGLKVETSPVSF